MCSSRYCTKKVAKIDLHTHTTASDGRYKTRKVVQFAAAKGIKYLAITDHDTLEGLIDIKELEKEYGLEIIPGIELSTTTDDEEIHILGLYLNLENQDIQKHLTVFRSKRAERIKDMVLKLNELGYDIKLDEVKAKATGNSLGRPHLALTLMEHGYVQTIQEAFLKLLGPDCPGFVPRFKISPLEAIKIIKKVGGLPVLAHPGPQFSSALLPSYIEEGLVGIEVFHPHHTPPWEAHYLDVARHYNLIPTGGSDFHGHCQLDFQNLGSMKVPLETIERLKEIKYKQS